MAAKTKKRLSKTENKLLKLDKLNLSDVICSICQSILIEPVALPCFHYFCNSCFNGSIENNALCCPLCRLRIGSWLRTATKQNNLINNELWKFIKSKFSKEIETKLKGDDITLPEDKPTLRLSAPGEIRLEYEAELKRLRTERELLEQKHLKETELLIKKLHEEEQEAHRKYLKRIKNDEILAQQIQENASEAASKPKQTECQNKGNLKINKIDNYLFKKTLPPVIKESPQITDDNTSNDSSTPKIDLKNRLSPEITPSYGKYLKNMIDKRIKNVTGIWNKENGKNSTKTTKNSDAAKEDNTKSTVISKTVPSLPVSLPYTGILKSKLKFEHRNNETGSVDSMRQELCYFKPIEGASTTSFKTGTGLPLKVPCIKVASTNTAVTPTRCSPPTRLEYLDQLSHLRTMSLSQNLPSAFVLALSILRMKKESPTKKKIGKKTKQTSPQLLSASDKKGSVMKLNVAEVDGVNKLSKTLRRTRSMGSITKAENETTPKKAKIKERKVCSERKHYLRSDTKKNSAKKSLGDLIETPGRVYNNNKIQLVKNNLSSPIDNCDVKKIVEEQLRIEKIIEQENNDFDLARKMEAEWNGGRQLRRAAVKRQVTINYALRPAKKLKV